MTNRKMKLLILLVWVDWCTSLLLACYRTQELQILHRRYLTDSKDLPAKIADCNGKRTDSLANVSRNTVNITTDLPTQQNRR
jgi:hypothetical protein